MPTLMAQALIAAAGVQQAARSTSASDFTAITTAVEGKNLPLPAQNQTASTEFSKEKKSASKSAEGTFLQVGTPHISAQKSSKDTLTMAPTLTSNIADGKTVTNFVNPGISASGGVASGTLSTAGTANVEKVKAMNAATIIPQLASLSGFGATGAPTKQQPADVNILLSSNNDFEDALKQVMHVAELNQTNESRAPMRVAIEIQTPPGAIVNVYVSRQNDQWRAQLSTNDTQALAWVQDKMSSLRQSNEFGVEVRWLPPQMESTPTATASSNANLGWDRDNQGQSQYQQPEDRPQKRKQAEEPAFAGVASEFMNTFAALGGVA